ncbi:hypothetical protein [Pontibacter anaerobius]|uniref:Uncharacterized protein n=1 Tax=Pontibacter anaerobius TaxID=2993940 RepID=A0ABT3RFT3_9BACT|nr:hypothetical protein [Pontibacter anaerobius]MCX2740343.1 hypothetical protein [Pontibacter anaerobius]
MFERLPLRSQAETLAKEGTILAQRQFNSWTVTLYTLNNKFVEVWTGEEAQVISTFKSLANPMTVLEPYLDGVNVEEVLGL